MPEEATHEFDFAISFARPDREVAALLAQELAERGYVVFYDRAFQSRLIGRRLHRDFKWVFGKGTRFFIPLVSAAYAERPWPQLEWSIAREEAERRPEEFILPLRRDDTILLGLPDDVAYLDLREYTVKEVAQILADKLLWPEIGLPVHLASNEWVATFGVLIHELVSDPDLPADAPKQYPLLCDWLEQDLMARLESLLFENQHMMESGRNGETLSVRVAFDWNPGHAPLEFGDLGWWEVLEVLPLGPVYPTGA